MNEVIREFLIETHENLAQLDLDLVTLEKESTERETLSRVFRTLHTVKGTAGFLGLEKLQAVAHGGENLLGRLRNGELVFDTTIASALLQVVDAIRKMLGSVEAMDTDGNDNFSPVIESLDRLHPRAAPATSAGQTLEVVMPAPTPTQSVAVQSPAPAPTTLAGATMPEPVETRSPA